MSQIERRRQFFKSLEAKSLRSRPLSTQIADKLTTRSGTPAFLFFNALLFLVWITINLGYSREIVPFDPFPFGLLTMIVSLEAIFLSIFVLISQNRQARINTIREEMHLRINLIAEDEITKVLEVLAEIRTKIGIKKPDAELEKMLEQINTNYIETSIAEQMNRADKSLVHILRTDIPHSVANAFKRPIELVTPHNSKEHEDAIKEKLKVLATK